MAIHVHTVTSQGTMWVAHGVPWFRHTATLALHDDCCCWVMNSRSCLGALLDEKFSDDNLQMARRWRTWKAFEEKQIFAHSQLKLSVDFWILFVSLRREEVEGEKHTLRRRGRFKKSQRWCTHANSKISWCCILAQRSRAEQRLWFSTGLGIGRIASGQTKLTTHTLPLFFSLSLSLVLQLYLVSCREREEIFFSSDLHTHSTHNITFSLWENFTTLKRLKSRRRLAPPTTTSAPSGEPTQQ